MNIDDVRKFLVDNHRGVMVARKRDGSPQMTLVTPGVDAEGRVVITARKSTFKVKNLSRDPEVSLLVMGEQFNGSKFYQIDGKAEILGLPDALELLVDAFSRTFGDRLTPEEARKKAIDEERVLIRIDIEKVGPQNRG